MDKLQQVLHCATLTENFLLFPILIHYHPWKLFNLKFFIIKIKVRWGILYSVFCCSTFWDSQRDFMSSGVQSTLKTLTFSCSEYKVAKSSNLDSYLRQSVHESWPKMMKVKAELWIASWNSWVEVRVGASAGSGLCLCLLTNPFNSCKTLKFWQQFYIFLNFDSYTITLLLSNVQLFAHLWSIAKSDIL